MNAQDLINELQTSVRLHMARAQEIAALPVERLLHRSEPDKWNVLEVFEHMNLSSGIYVRGLECAFDAKAASHKPNGVFHPGLLGNYFTKGMLPRPDGTIRNRMKTMRMFDPPRNKGASKASISSFISIDRKSVV